MQNGNRKFSNVILDLSTATCYKHKLIPFISKNGLWSLGPGNENLSSPSPARISFSRPASKFHYFIFFSFFYLFAKKKGGNLPAAEKNDGETRKSIDTVPSIPSPNQM